MKSELPSDHEVRKCLQNEFARHLNELKAKITVSSLSVSYDYTAHSNALVIVESSRQGFDNRWLLDSGYHEGWFCWYYSTLGKRGKEWGVGAWIECHSTAWIIWRPRWEEFGLIRGRAMWLCGLDRERWVKGESLVHVMWSRLIRLRCRRKLRHTHCTWTLPSPRFAQPAIWSDDG